jgi:hypothetical protein
VERHSKFISLVRANSLGRAACYLLIWLPALPANCKLQLLPPIRLRFARF